MTREQVKAGRQSGRVAEREIISDKDAIIGIIDMMIDSRMEKSSASRDAMLQNDVLVELRSNIHRMFSRRD